jgi:UDP-glucose 4-epimerase
MVRILLTGASGFIGRNFLLATPRDWQIVATYNASRDFPRFLNEKNLHHVTAIHCDLTSIDAVRALWTAHGQQFDLCLYLAANVSIPLSVEQPTTDLEANTIGLLNVLGGLRCGRFVYLSSGAVYDGLVGPVGPSVALRPRIPYSISKLSSELYVRFFRERRQTLDSYVVLRFFGAYGPYEPPRKIYTKLVRALALECQNTFSVIGDGHNLIDAMYVSDAVDGLMRVLESNVNDVTVDFASGAPMTIDELVCRTSLLFANPVELIHTGRTEEYIEFSVGPEQMERLFGFRPQVSLESGLTSFRDFLAAEDQQYN